MSPEQYREKWGLPPDYPMVAPNYAAARSRLAKQMGLGQQRRRRAEITSEVRTFGTAGFQRAGLSAARACVREYVAD